MHFSRHEMYWECQSFLLQETSPVPLNCDNLLLSKPSIVSRMTKENTAFLRLARSNDSLATARSRLVSLVDKTRYMLGMAGDLENSAPILNRFWPRIILTYNCCDLTYEGDKLTAIEGLANAVARLSGQTYFAGLWLEDIARGLFWGLRGGTSVKSLRRQPAAKGEFSLSLCSPTIGTIRLALHPTGHV
jgi:hypothetical protein